MRTGQGRMRIAIKLAAWQRDLKTKIPQHLRCNRFGSRSARREVDNQALYLPTRQRGTDLLPPFLRRRPNLHGSKFFRWNAYLLACLRKLKQVAVIPKGGGRSHQHEFLHHDEIGSLCAFRASSVIADKDEDGLQHENAGCCHRCSFNTLTCLANFNLSPLISPAASEASAPVVPAPLCAPCGQEKPKSPDNVCAHRCSSRRPVTVP